MLARFKRILKEEKITSREFAKLLGVTYPSFRSMTKKSSVVIPKWVTAFVIAYHLGKGIDDDGICTFCEEKENGFGEDGLFCKECHKMLNG